MARPREQLDKILCDIVGSEERCYFVAPSNIGMKYPCIKYNLSGYLARYANNRKYITANEYTITVIDENEESGIVQRILKYELPFHFDRQYISDGLYHTVFSLYF